MPDNLRITLDEVRRKMDSGEPVVFLDTRNPQAWADSDEKVPGAIRVPVDGFESRLSEIPQNKPIVIYCT